MTKIKKEENDARLGEGRAFLCRLKTNMACPNVTAHLIFWPIAVLGLVADLWSKWAVFELLRDKPGNYISIIDGVFRLVMALNDGAAFGIGSGMRLWLTAVSVVALAVLFVYFFFFSAKQRSKWTYLILALFAAGICGNLYDRIFNQGSVRDFIDIVYWPGKHWPAFNLADSMLCIAVGLVMICGIFTGKSDQKCGQQHK